MNFKIDKMFYYYITRKIFIYCISYILFSFINKNIIMELATKNEGIRLWAREKNWLYLK